MGRIFSFTLKSGYSVDHILLVDSGSHPIRIYRASLTKAKGVFMKHNLRHPKQRTLTTCVSLFALALIPGCTWLNNVASDWPPQNEQQRAQQQARAQSATRSTDSPGAMAGTQREYRYTQMPEQPGRQQQMNSNMAGPRGLQVDQQSNNSRQQSQTGGGHQNKTASDRQLRQRLRRIEQQLAMLRRDFADIKPVMRKVQAAENQIHQLSRELSQIDGGAMRPSRSQSQMPGSQAGQPQQRAPSQQAAHQRNASAPPMTWRQARRLAQQQARQRADQHQRSYEQQQQQALQQQQDRQELRGNQGSNQQATTGEAYVQKVRNGIFQGNTRLVLDLSRPADFSYDLDNRENLLVVEIDGAGWRAPEMQEITGSDLISSISASTTRQGGSRMVVELSGDAEVVRAQSLPPTGNNGHRIFMDLAAK